MEFLLCMNDLGDYDIGDIIDVRSDGFNWGTGERNNPRFKLVRIDDVDVGLSLEAAQVKYLVSGVFYCDICEKYIQADEVVTHCETVHSDILYNALENPPRRKTTEEIGIRNTKKRRWAIDGHGFAGGQVEISEKVLASGDTVIAYLTEKTVDAVVL